jgi:hypothetical protein
MITTIALHLGWKEEKVERKRERIGAATDDGRLLGGRRSETEQLLWLLPREELRSGERLAAVVPLPKGETMASLRVCASTILGLSHGGELSDGTRGGSPTVSRAKGRRGRFSGDQRLGFGSTSGTNACASARGMSRRRHSMQATIRDRAHACKPKENPRW